MIDLARIRAARDAVSRWVSPTPLIRSEHFTYEIDDGVVHTAEPVSVRFGPHVLNSRGLRAELNAGTLRLESDVNGRFVP